MKWIITIVIIAILGVLAWLIFPKLSNQSAPNMLHMLPEDTWMIISIQPGQTSLFNDTNAFLFNWSLAKKIRPILHLVDSNTTGAVTVFLHGKIADPKSGLILQQKKPSEAIKSRFQHIQTLQGLTFLSQEALTNKATDHLGIEPLLAAQSAENRIILRPAALAEKYLSALPAAFAVPLGAQLANESWIAFDFDENSGLFSAQGTGITPARLQSGVLGHNALRYLPSNTALVMQIELNKHPHTFAQIASNQSKSPTLYMLRAKESDTIQSFAENQSYQGIPITINPIETYLKPFVPWNEQSYVAHFGRLEIMAANFEDLVKLIDQFMNDNTLTTTAQYQKVLPTMSDASFTLYVRPDLMYNAGIEEDSNAIKDVNALVFQTFSELEAPAFYALSALHHNTIIEQPKVVWSTLLDTTILAGPWEFKNHYNGEKEFIIQDSKQNLYLINNTGKILWKQGLKSDIVGDIQMVDAYSNSKFQMLFATSDALHLIDRLGNNVEGFPVKMSGEVMNTPLALRYDNKGDLRILVSDGNILKNMDAEGKTVKGWTNPKLAGSITQPIEYLKYAGKDYLIAIANSEKIYFLDRTGSERLKTINAPNCRKAYTLITGKRFEDCLFLSSDSVGNIISVNTSGESKTHPGIHTGLENITVFHKNKELEALSLENDHLLLLTNNFQSLNDIVLPEKMEAKIQIFEWPKTLIGMQSLGANRFYVMHPDGNVLEKMPMNGAGKALITDLQNDGNIEIIISDGKRSLVAHQINTN